MTPDLRQERLSYAPRLSVITDHLRWCLAWDRKWLGSILAVLVGVVLWYYPPSAPLDERGVHFLAILGAGVTLWVFEVFDEYVVALMMLLAWVVLGGIPTNVALAGFSQKSWFFALGAVGMAAAVAKTGLLRRFAHVLLSRMPPFYWIYNFTLAGAGLLVTPFLPNAKSRLAIVCPISRAIAESLGFAPRSNGCAGISLAAYIGFSQMSFMFLTGASSCLIGWNLLSEETKAQFGWTTWAIAAFPAGIIMLLFLFVTGLLLFPVKEKHQIRFLKTTSETEPREYKPLTRGEWVSLTVLGLAVAGWLGKPLHGISEAWVALAALVVFLITRVLDKKGLKNDIDWGFLLFFGVMSSVGSVMVYLKMNQWLLGILDPVISTVSFHPTVFLLTVLLLVYVVRFFVHKAPAVILLMVSLMPWAQSIGIHPGVLLLTILMGIESWFLPYQTDSYLIAYSITDGKAFSHGQARSLMAGKFIASFIAVALSVPYWSSLGYIVSPIDQSERSGLARGKAEAETVRATNSSIAPNKIPTPNSTVESTDRLPTVLSTQQAVFRIDHDGSLVTRVRGPLAYTANRPFREQVDLLTNGNPKTTLGKPPSPTEAIEKESHTKK